MKQILILGAGKFGRQAVAKLTRNERSRVTVVDSDSTRCAAVAGEGVDILCEEGISHLADSLENPEPPDWIIPAIPTHVAFEWLRTTLPEGVHLEVFPVPGPVRARIPNPMAGDAEQVYASYADFICPDDCPEPADTCSYTGQPRKGILFKTLAQIQYENYTAVVVRSRQLAPGLGGYRPGDLLAARNAVLSAQGPVLFSTACKCHGVMQAFRLSDKGGPD